MIKNFFRKNKKKKIFLIVVLILAIFWFWPDYNKDVEYGVTFSAKYARELGLNPKEVLEKTFTDLNIKKIRLVVYWDDFEKEKDNHNFSDIDWQIEMAKKYQAEVILAVGKRVPRCPECNMPEWTLTLPWEEQKK